MTKTRSGPTSLRTPAAILMLPFLGFCGAPAFPGVAVSYSNLPSGTLTIVPKLTLNGQQILTDANFGDALASPAPQLAFELPRGTRGLFEIKLQAQNFQNCNLAALSLQVSLDEDVRYDLGGAFSNMALPPTIANVSPSQLLNDRPARLTIQGDNFDYCSRVTFGGTMNVGLLLLDTVSQTELSGVMTPNQLVKPCGSVPLVITNRDLQSAASTISFYASPPC